jgi:hypothetical protein
MKYLLDTNIVSELRKKTPNTNVVQWFHGINHENLYISCLTIGELQFGAQKKLKSDIIQGQLLIKWIDDLVSIYNEQIIDIDISVSEEWGRLLNIDSSNAIDSLLAAQSIICNMTLVTRNIKHFKMFDIKLINPFDININ